MNTSVARRVVTVAVTALIRPVAAQDDVRKLFESGKYKDVVERTSGDIPPEARYLRALAYRKLDQNDQAKGAFRQLAGAGDAWRAVGESAVAMIDGNADDAVNAARTAVERDGDLAEAHFQLGRALDAKGVTACRRCTPGPSEACSRAWCIRRSPEMRGSWTSDAAPGRCASTSPARTA